MVDRHATRSLFFRLVNHVNWIFILHFWTTILFPACEERGAKRGPREYTGGDYLNGTDNSVIRDFVEEKYLAL